MVSAAEQLASNLNFSAFAKAEELKKRIWFTLAALVVYRFGTYIPIPGINPVAFAESFKAILRHPRHVQHVRRRRRQRMAISRSTSCPTSPHPSSCS
jgi:hypothetical protein